MNHYEFLASAEIAPVAEGKRRLSGIAYAGGVITDHPHFSRIAFDLASTTISTPIPLLLCHDHDDPVGVITTAVIDTAIRIESDLFTGIDDDADAIAAKADAGMPWQLSVGIWPGEITEISANTSIPLNGTTVTGPLTVFKNNIIREISVVTLGADSKTSATVFNLQTQEDTPMQDTPENNGEYLAQIAKLETEIAELKATNAELTQQISEFSAQKRQEKVKALFLSLNREYTEESAQVYLDLNDAQFAAIESDLITHKPAFNPDYLFSAQATHGAELNPSDAAKRLFNQVAGV